MDEILEEKKEELAQDSPTPATEEQEAGMANDMPAQADEVEATDDTQSVEAVGEESDPADEQAEPDAPVGQAEKMIPQSVVNELIGKTRMEARNKAREEYASEQRQRWGVESDDELDGIFGDGQRYSALNDEYGIAQKTITDLQTENALLKSQVSPDKWEDVKAIMAYQHLQVTPETIASLLPSHPEWAGAGKSIDAQPQGEGGFPQAPQQGDAKPSVIERLGGEPSPSQDEDIEALERKKAFEAMNL